MLRLCLSELKIIDLESNNSSLTESIAKADSCLFSGDQINAQQFYQKAVNRLNDLKQEKSLLMAILQKKWEIHTVT